MNVLVPRKPARNMQIESLGMVEFNTVALSGEIFLEIEGSYTCIGLSLVELFYQGPAVVEEDPTLQPHDPFSHASKVTSDLRYSWEKAGAHCAARFEEASAEMKQRQEQSRTYKGSPEVQYLNEWARGPRLAESTARYCRPGAQPPPGEEGWTAGGRMGDGEVSVPVCPNRLVHLITEALAKVADGGDWGGAESSLEVSKGGGEKGQGRSKRGWLRRQVHDRGQLWGNEGRFGMRAVLPEWLQSSRGKGEEGVEELALRA
ncbi:unnamed protein product, partial [Choristocarpus tenellus]